VRGARRVYPALLRHRTCAPEHRELVQRHCVTDRRVLPRYHQDDRGRTRRNYGHHELAAPGSYTGVLAWQSREHWLTFVVPVVFAMHPDQAAKYRIKPATLAAFVRVKSGYADPRTGRRCIVRPDTLASVLGITKRRVQQYNAYLRAVGLETVIQTGRMLTYAEKMHLWRTGIKGRGRGSRQRGLSTEVALTIPTPAIPDIRFTPGSTSGTTPKNLTFHNTSHHGGAETEPASPAPPRQAERPKPPTPAIRLAKQLRNRLWWLKHERPARMAPALSRFATARPSWTAEDIATAIIDARRRRGIIVDVDPGRITSCPAVVLAYWLRQIDHQADHPRLPHLTPEDLRCGRSQCVHGWITLGDPLDPLSPVSRCTECRPGAWPVELEELAAEATTEPPF
jgi:hypothetical protein